MYTQAFRSFPRSFRGELLTYILEVELMTCKLNLWLASWGFMTIITLLVSQPPQLRFCGLKRVDRRNNNSPVNLLPCSPSAALGQPKPRVDTDTTNFGTPQNLLFKDVCMYIYILYFTYVYYLKWWDSDGYGNGVWLSLDSRSDWIEWKDVVYLLPYIWNKKVFATGKCWFHLS